MKKIRELFVDGVLLALPIGAAAFLVVKVIGLLVPLLTPAKAHLPNGTWLGVAALDVVALGVLGLGLIGLGLFSRSRPGRRLAESLEQMVLSKIPGYLIVKSIVADFGSADADGGLKPALVSFDDNQVLGYVVEQDVGADRFAVFIPGAPSPGSGSVVVVPGARVQVLGAPLSHALRSMRQRGHGLLALAAAHAPPVQAGPPDQAR